MHTAVSAGRQLSRSAALISREKRRATFGAAFAPKRRRESGCSGLPRYVGCVMIPKTGYAVPVCLLLCASEARAQDVVDLAASLIGRPYVWGAEGPRSFDCSGLTQFVFKEFGVELPRRAVSQSRSGVAAGRRLQRGDLLFFSTDTRRSLVTHVGIYEAAGVMIDASQSAGRVRRDSLDDRYWADRFMFARRIGLRLSEGERRERARPRAGDPDPRSGGRRETAIRVLKGVADVLFDLPRR